MRKLCMLGGLCLFYLLMGTTRLRFFYIDKTTLSYAAIFDIEEDLNLHGTQYNWLRYGIAITPCLKRC